MNVPGCEEFFKDKSIDILSEYESFLANKPADMIPDLEKAYKLGYNCSKEEVYDDGYQNGYDDGKDECLNDYEDGYNSGYENGTITGKNLIIEELGYSDIVSIQEKTGYHICFGTEVNIKELIHAIKELVK